MMVEVENRAGRRLMYHSRHTLFLFGYSSRSSLSACVHGSCKSWQLAPCLLQLDSIISAIFKRHAESVISRIRYSDAFFFIDVERWSTIHMMSPRCNVLRRERERDAVPIAIGEHFLKKAVHRNLNFVAYNFGALASSGPARQSAVIPYFAVDFIPAQVEAREV